MISGIDYGRGNDESCTITFVSPEYIKELEQENQQLKDRITKAIEYIKKHRQVYDIDGSVEPKLDEFDILASPKVLLEILKGNNKED